MKRKMIAPILAALVPMIGISPSIAQMNPNVEKRDVAVKGAGYFPVLLRLKTGRLLVVYRYGASHIDVRGKLAVSWSDDDGRTWSSPRVAVSGENDHLNAIMTIKPGAGGTESQDWAAILLRMYLRWAERKGIIANVLDETPGEEAGIKNATV